MTHISARVQVYAHNQPKLTKPGVRVASLSWRHGSKDELLPLAAILYAMVVDVADFYVGSGAGTAEEGLVEMRKLLAGLTQAVNSYEQAMLQAQEAP